MVSYPHVRARRDVLTKDLLRRLDAAMAVYVHQFSAVPSVPEFIPDQQVPPEDQLRRAAARNDEAVIRALKSASLLKFDDVSIAYYDEARVRDAWEARSFSCRTCTRPSGWIPRDGFSSAPGGSPISHAR